MAKTFDIDRLIAEQSGNLGTPGNRNPVDVADTERVLKETRDGNADLIVTPTGKLASSTDEEIINLAKTNPELLLQKLKDKKLSFGNPDHAKSIDKDAEKLKSP